MPIKSPKQIALYLLGRRDYTAHQLQQKLEAKHYSQEDITPLLDELMIAGWLNDERFAENYIRTRRQKGYGPKRIAIELTTRGVPDVLIAEKLDIHDNAWLADARKIWQKQFKGQLPKDHPTKTKHIRFLLYRGFTLDLIMTLLSSGYYDTE